MIVKANTFYVDMNSLRGNHIGTLLSHIRFIGDDHIRIPQIGDIVLVCDQDVSDHTYHAMVNDRDGMWVGLEILWNWPDTSNRRPVQ